MNAGMAEVIAAHSIYGMSAGTHSACRCNRAWVPHSEYRAHLTEELAKAGYGNVAEAWDEGFCDGERQGAEGDDGPKFVNPYREATHGVD